MKSKKRMMLTLISITTFAVILTAWQMITDVFQLVPEYLLPSPLGVLDAFCYKLSGGINPEGATIYEHIITSFSVALGGFAMGVIIGVPMGIAMAWWKKVDLFVRPLFDLLRPIPPLAWIPLMILWFGIGYKTKVIIIFVSALIACVVNSYMGIKLTRDVHIWAAKTFGATNLQILFKVAIPTALPSIFTGIRLSLGSAWMALVAAEMVASTKGLGYMIQMARQMGRADIIIVGMLTIGVIGAFLSFALEKFFNRILKKGDRR